MGIIMGLLVIALWVGAPYRPFAGNELWVFGIFLIFIAGLTALAYWLSSLRDLGAGIISQRPGPARASKNLSSVTGTGLETAPGHVTLLDNYIRIDGSHAWFHGPNGH